MSEKMGRLKLISKGAKAWLGKFAKFPIAKESVRDLRDMIDLLNDYADGKYRKIPKRLILAIAAALLYVLSPADLLPGFLDDMLIITFILDLGVSGELKKYREWKKNTEL